MDPSFRAYHAFAAKFGVHPHATRIIVDYALNHTLNQRIGIPLSLIENRNDELGTDKKELMSEADLIVTSAILWLYSPYKKTPMRGFLSKQFQLKKVEHGDTPTYDEFIHLINELDKSVSIDDTLILYVAITYMDFMTNYASEIYYPDDFGEQNLKLVVESSCVGLCFLTSRKNVDNLLKEKVYRVCFMHDIAQDMAKNAEDYSLSYFSNTLSTSNSYLSNLRRIVNSVDKLPEEVDDTLPSCSSIIEPTKKRLSPSYEDPAYASYKEESSEETTEEEEEDHNYTSSLTKKLAKKRNLNIDPSNASKGKLDPFKKVGNALKEFTASNSIEMPVYRVGMKIENVFDKKKEPIKPIPKPKADPDARILTYAEMKQKQKEEANGTMRDSEYEDILPKDKKHKEQKLEIISDFEDLTPDSHCDNSEFEDLTPESEDEMHAYETLENDGDVNTYDTLSLEYEDESNAYETLENDGDVNTYDTLSLEYEDEANAYDTMKCKINFDELEFVDDTLECLETSVIEEVLSDDTELQSSEIEILVSEDGAESSDNSYDTELHPLEEDKIEIHENGTCYHFASLNFLN